MLYAVSIMDSENSWHGKNIVFYPNISGSLCRSQTQENILLETFVGLLAASAEKNLFLACVSFPSYFQWYNLNKQIDGRMECLLADQTYIIN